MLPVDRDQNITNPFAGWAGNTEHSEHFLHLSIYARTFGDASGGSACAPALKPKIPSRFSTSFPVTLVKPFTDLCRAQKPES